MRSGPFVFHEQAEEKEEKEKTKNEVKEKGKGDDKVNQHNQAFIHYHRVATFSRFLVFFMYISLQRYYCSKRLSEE